jgi:predicted glycosyltransferase
MSKHPKVVLLYAEDQSGLGHINITVTLARKMVELYDHVMAVIATGATVGDAFDLPPRCDHVKLPTRRPLVPAAIGEDRESPSDRPPVYRGRLKRRFRSLRRRLLLDTALELKPDLVLVDHEPLGYDAEFRDGLYALKAASPSTRFVFLMRDIADDPEWVRADWAGTGALEALDQIYDEVVVYGLPAMYDVVDAYALPPQVSSKLRYCSYIVRDHAAVDAMEVRRRHGVPPAAPLLVATVGSGSDGYPVLAATREALPDLRRQFPDLHALLVTGPYMPRGEQAVLQAEAGPGCTVLVKADTIELLFAADASVSMGGYNSVFEALAAACPLVIVPRMPQGNRKREQTIRADALAAHDLALSVSPNSLTGEAVGKAVAAALRRDRGEYAQRVRAIIPSFDGAARLVTWESPWLQAREDKQT